MQTAFDADEGMTKILKPRKASAKAKGKAKAKAQAAAQPMP